MIQKVKKKTKSTLFSCLAANNINVGVGSWSNHEPNVLIPLFGVIPLDKIDEDS